MQRYIFNRPENAEDYALTNAQFGNLLTILKQLEHLGSDRIGILQWYLESPPQNCGGISCV